MRTIDLSVMQRYNHKRIREEIAKKERTDQADSGKWNSIDHGDASNEPPEVNPSEGTDKTTPEELETQGKEQVRREKIIADMEVEQKRIEAELTKQIQDIKTDVINNERHNQAARERVGIEIDTKRQQDECDLLAEEARARDLRNQMERKDLENQKIRLDQESQDINNREREHQLAVERRKEDGEARRQKINSIFRAFLMALFATLLLIILAVIAHRMWRWSVEEPLIKEVIEEVVVEKKVIEEVIKEVEVEIEVIPPECTQIRRNGKVYVSCDGVTIDGASTISESGVEVPELLDDPD